jgi:hypothetical protein
MFDAFYAGYVAVCGKMLIAPLPEAALRALTEALADRAGADAQWRWPESSARR